MMQLFAQSDFDKTISHFVTSDVPSKNTMTLLKKGTNLKFNIISSDVPYTKTFGILDF